MTAEEAVDYGIIDEMIQTKTGHITKPPCPSSRGGGGTRTVGRDQTCHFARNPDPGIVAVCA